MNYKELELIINGMNKLKSGVPFYIFNINKAEDIIAYDINWGK